MIGRFCENLRPIPLFVFKELIAVILPLFQSFCRKIYRSGQRKFFFIVFILHNLEQYYLCEKVREKQNEKKNFVA